MKRDKEFRFHQKERVIKNRKKDIKSTKYPPGLKNGKAINILNKHHPFDCGHAKCSRCHLDKFDKKTKRKRRRVEQNINDEQVPGYIRRQTSSEGSSL